MEFSKNSASLIISDKVYLVSFINLVKGGIFYNFNQEVDLTLDDVKKIKSWSIDKID